MILEFPSSEPRIDVLKHLWLAGKYNEESLDLNDQEQPTAQFLDFTAQRM